MSDRETVKLVGEVRGEGLVCGDLKLRIEEGLPDEKEIRRGFELVTDAGQRVQVLADKARLVGEEQERRGSYGELAEDPRLACFETRPGPHVRVEVRGLSVVAGDRVAILAEVTRRGYLEGTADYRSAPEEQILEVRASRIACGPGAEGLLEPAARPAAPPPEADEGDPSGDWIRRNVLALVLALLAVAALMLRMPAQSRVAASGLLLVLAVLFVFRRGAPRFHPLDTREAMESWDEEAEKFPGAAALLIAIIISLFGWPVVTWADLDLTSRQILAAAVVGLPALVGFFYLRARSAAGRRRLRAMLRAAPLPADAQEGFGALTGTLGSPGDTGKLALYSFFPYTSSEQVTTGSGVQTRVHHRLAERSEVAGDIVLHSGAKRINVPRAHEVLWASTEQRRSKRSWKSLNFPEPRKTTDHFITPGSQALVVGQLRSEQLLSTGPESLLLFASGSAEPRATARRALESPWILGVILGLLTAMPLVLPRVLPF